MRETTDKQNLSYELTKNNPTYIISLKVKEKIQFQIRTLNLLKLYQKCWRYEPDERPSIEQVILELNNIDSKNNTSHQVNSELNDSDNVNIENNRIEKSKNTEELERNAIESMNGDLYLSKFLS
ncbi:unnamed protein product [Rhizophagus irregularis]|nr:unnamed protein product [Rhizophagus irregularis]